MDVDTVALRLVNACLGDFDDLMTLRSLVLHARHVSFGAETMDWQIVLDKINEQLKNYNHNI